MCIIPWLCAVLSSITLPVAGSEGLVPTVASGVIGCPVTVSTSLFISLPGPRGGEHFEAMWRLSEAAEPQGLSECGRCLHEVSFSLSLWHWFHCILFYHIGLIIAILILSV